MLSATKSNKSQWTALMFAVLYLYLEKENACFYAAVEEVKHWKSLIH